MQSRERPPPRPLYAVYGNQLVKLDPDSGRIVRCRSLPEDPNGTGAAYNGMVVPDGEQARSPVLSDVPAPGNIVTPGFGGRFWYVSARGALWALRARG